MAIHIHQVSVILLKYMEWSCEIEMGKKGKTHTGKQEKYRRFDVGMHNFGKPRGQMHLCGWEIA